MNLYIGPFQWRERISSKTGLPSPAGVFGWRMPTGATQAIEIGPDKGTGIVDEFKGRAVFVTPDDVILPSPYNLFATDPLEVMGPVKIAAMRQMFGVTASSAVRFLPLLHELSTTHEDLSKTIKAPPRITGRGRRIKWILGDFRLSIEADRGSTEWLGVRARHRLTYRRIRESDGLLLLHRKYLGAMMRRYSLQDFEVMDEFIPSDLPREEPLEPSTTVTESFPGSTDTVGGDQTWTETSGDWDNASGVAAFTVGGFADNLARCESALSTDDMRVQCAMTSAANLYYGPVARFVSSGDDDLYRISANLSINDYYCNSVVTGTSTDIITSELTGSITPPSTDAIEVDGDAIEIFQATNSRGSTTDTGVSGNVRGGIYGAASGGTSSRSVLDDWQAEDLAAAAATGLLMKAPNLRGNLSGLRSLLK